MSITQFAPKESYTGTGSLDTYSFDFKIVKNTQLLVIVLNASGVETLRVRGDDNTFIDTLTFDTNNGGGEVVLQANLPASYTLILLQADDEPTQDFQFRNSNTFNLRSLENALDVALGAIQRLVYRMNRAIGISDLDDETAINLQLPPGFADNSDKTLKVNLAGDGLDYGPTGAQIASAETYALQALDAAVAANMAKDAAEAAAAAIGAVTFVELVGLSGSLELAEIGILRAGSAFGLTLLDAGLVVGSSIEIKCLGFSGNLTVVSQSAKLIDGSASKVLPFSSLATYRFRYTGTEFIIS